MGLDEFDYSRFFNKVIDLCIIIDETHIKKANKSYLDAVGQTEEFIYKTPIAEIIHPDDAEETLEKVFLLNLRPEFYYSCRNLCGDGSYITINWTAVLDPETGLMYCIGKDESDKDEALKKVSAEIEVIHDKLAAAVENI